MMTDRELLELAAKANGHVFVDGESWDEDAGWNPLTDDGDALRLAVKLQMVVDSDWNGGANAETHRISFDYPEFGFQEGSGRPDPYAATRRAIVRAAAEIGRTL